MNWTLLYHGTPAGGNEPMALRAARAEAANALEDVVDQEIRTHHARAYPSRWHKVVGVVAEVFPVGGTT